MIEDNILCSTYKARVFLFETDDLVKIVHIIKIYIMLNIDNGNKVVIVLNPSFVVTIKGLLNSIENIII